MGKGLWIGVILLAAGACFWGVGYVVARTTGTQSFRRCWKQRSKSKAFVARTAGAWPTPRMRKGYGRWIATEVLSTSNLKNYKPAPMLWR